MERAWTDDICALLLCHPDNPTGTVWSPDEMAAMLHWASVKHIYVISDEVYGASCHSSTRTSFNQGHGAIFYSCHDSLNRPVGTGVVEESLRMIVA